MKPILFFLFVGWQGLLYSQPNPCATATMISCGNEYPGTTVGGVSHFDSNDYGSCYAGEFSFNGNDTVFQLDVTERKNIHLYLEVQSKNLDMFVLEACSASQVTVLNYSNGGGCVATLEDNTSLNVLNKSIDFIANPGTYYIVIDGENTVQDDTFALTVGCTCDCTEDIDPDLPFGRSIRCEDFEHYETTGINSQSNRWRLFTTTNSDALVETQSGNEYLRIVRNVERPDVIYDLTDLTNGRHRISWKMFVETGKGGYYSFLNRLPDEIGQLFDLAYEVVFNADGSGNVTVNSNQVFPFTYQQNTWINIMQIVDPASDLVEFYIDHEFISSWKYADGADVSPYRIQGIRFFAQPGNNYRVDNICAWEVKGDNVNCPPKDVCIKNGGHFDDECSASHDFLYTPDEFDNCFSVCDFGGTFIFRDDLFMGTIDSNDEIPNLVRSDSCVKAVFGGSVPADYGAVIKVFYNERPSNILPSISGQTNPDSVKVFVFQCIEDSISQQFSQINLGEVTDSSECEKFDQIETLDTGFYYIVFIGPVGQNFGVNMYPNGDCQGTATLISCGQSIVDSLSGESNVFDLVDSDKGDYAKCYNGLRTYTGGDMVFRFDLTEPSIINLSLIAGDQKAIFLYDYLCAKNCIGYAETPNSGGPTSLSDFHLAPGTYYVIVDQENDLDSSFTLSLNCDLDLNFYTTFTGIEDLGNCPIVNNPDSIHKLHILDFASTTDLKPGTYVAIGHRDGEETKSVVKDFWKSMPSQLFNLPPDFQGDTTKCSFVKDDDIQVTLYVNPTGNGNLWVPCNVSFAPLMPPLITAEGKFIAGKESVVNGLSRKNIYSIYISATSISFPAMNKTSAITVNTSNVSQTVTVDPEATWLHVNPGSPKLVLNVDPNPDQQVRQGFITLRFTTDPVFIQKISVKQNGLCIKPNVSFILDPGSNVVCIGQPFTLKADVTNGLDEFFSYDWGTGETSQVISRIGMASQSFTVTVTEKTCNADTVRTITIPGVSAPVANAGIDMQICPGIPVTLTGSPANGVTYAWSNGENTKSIIVNPMVTTVYALTVSNGQCSDVDSVQVNVLTAPVANAGDDMPTCLGMPVTLTASPDNGVTYLWSNGQTTKTIVVNPIATTVYVLTVSNGQCTDVDSVAVSVLPAPVANAGDDEQICPGIPVTLTASPDNGVTYAWSNGQTTQSVIVNPNVNTVYVLTVSIGQCADVDSIQVFVFPETVANAGEDQSICPGGTAMLVANEMDGNAYQWSTGQTTPTIIVTPSGYSEYFLTVTSNGCQDIDTVAVDVFPLDVWTIIVIDPIKCFGAENGQLSIGSESGQKASSLAWSNGSMASTIGNLGAGTYTVTVTDMNECSQTSTINLTQPVELKVDTQSIMHPSGGNNGTIEISVSGGTMPYTYNWSLNGEPVAGGALLEQLGAGCYKIVVTDTNLCKDSIDCIELITGLVVLGDQSLMIYPNPTDGIVYLESDNTSSAPLSLQVYQQMGNLVLSDKQVRTDKNVPYLIDLSGQPPGVYYLYFQQGLFLGSQKLIIH